MLAARATLDRVLELVETTQASATELRVLLALLDRGACLSDLAEALDAKPDEITRAGRRLSMRGLIRWHHVGRRKQTRLEITSSGLSTVRALLTAAGATSAAADRPEAAADAPEHSLAQANGGRGVNVPDSFGPRRSRQWQGSADPRDRA